MFLILLANLIVIIIFLIALNAPILLIVQNVKTVTSYHLIIHNALLTILIAILRIHVIII